MMRLLPGDTVRVTDLESENWARPRRTIMLINSLMTQIQGASLNITGAGFYVEFQSALRTRGKGDPGFVITYEPNRRKSRLLTPIKGYSEII